MVPALPADLACPPTHVETGVTVETLATGYLLEQRKRIIDIGNTQGTIPLVDTVGLIHHPQGLVLVDSGLGTTTLSGRFPTFPLGVLDLYLEPDQTLLSSLEEPPIRFLITHGHYDHIGGLTDFPDTPIWIDSREHQRLGLQAGVPKRQYRKLPWVPVDMTRGGDRRVLGRPAVDAMGDGSIWYLSTPGHTNGSAAVLVLTAEQPWLFLGDTAWVFAHLQDARRPPLISRAVDSDRDQLEDSLAWARWLYQSCPELVIVPGHEDITADPRSTQVP
jgi:glyoxylase-like metal-dependent hydrolase (beta-lactamase superfamily II)